MDQTKNPYRRFRMSTVLVVAALFLVLPQPVSSHHREGHGAGNDPNPPPPSPPVVITAPFYAPWAFHYCAPSLADYLNVDCLARGYADSDGIMSGWARTVSVCHPPNHLFSPLPDCDWTNVAEQTLHGRFNLGKPLSSTSRVDLHVNITGLEQEATNARSYVQLYVDLCCAYEPWSIVLDPSEGLGPRVFSLPVPTGDYTNYGVTFKLVEVASYTFNGLPGAASATANLTVEKIVITP